MLPSVVRLVVGGSALLSMAGAATLADVIGEETGPKPQLASSKALAEQSQSFIRNDGQWNGEAKFLSRLGGLDAWVTSDGLTLQYQRVVVDPEWSWREDDPIGKALGGGKRVDRRDERELRQEHSRLIGHVVKLRFLGADPNARAAGEGVVPGEHNYFIGNDESKWATRVPWFKRVTVQGLYPGVRALYYVDRAQPRYDLVLGPGEDPSKIRFVLEGADSVRLTPEGKLAFTTRFGETELADLRAFQGGTEITCAYRLDPSGVVSFALGGYDRAKPLTIDPLVYSSYLGGSHEDYAGGICLDRSGCALVTGTTYSPNFPTTGGAFDRLLTGTTDGFVTKFTQSGDSLVFSSYLGGSSSDYGIAVVVGPAGNAVLTGTTVSADFPTTPGALDTTYGSVDAFVVKLSVAGSGLVYSPYLGGTSIDRPGSVAMDAGGCAWVSGSTGSSDFPTTPRALDRSLGGPSDVFVSRLSPTGESLICSTYLGGTNNLPSSEHSGAVAVDAAGFAYVGGRTDATDFPTTPGAFDRTYNGDDGDGFVTKLAPSGKWLAYSTYLGGSANEGAEAVAVDSAGCAYVAGTTESPDFPTTSGAYDTDNGRQNAFLTKLAASGSSLEYSTYLGGWYAEAWGVSVDPAGRACLSGSTGSNDFPTTDGAFDEDPGTPPDVFVTRFSMRGDSLVYSTLLGGSGSSRDESFDLALDAAGTACVIGYTDSPDFPTTLGAFDRTYSGGYADGFLSKLDLKREIYVGPPPQHTGP